MRVRAFTQDDAHIFCTADQITEESVKVTELILSIYRDFGFDDVAVKLATRPASTSAIGTDLQDNRPQAECGSPKGDAPGPGPVRNRIPSPPTLPLLGPKPLTPYSAPPHEGAILC